MSAIARQILRRLLLGIVELFLMERRGETEFETTFEAQHTPMMPQGTKAVVRICLEKEEKK
jgi:hypothetical protein